MGIDTESNSALIGIVMKTTRAYTMRARAEQADRTRARILDAAVELAGERPLAACTLPAVVSNPPCAWFGWSL